MRSAAAAAAKHLRLRRQRLAAPAARSAKNLVAAARPLGRPVVRWYSHPVGVNTPCRMGSPGCRDVPRVVRLAALARADERRRKEIGPSARACSGAAGGAVAVGPRPDGPAPDGPTPASCGCGRAGGARRVNEGPLSRTATWKVQEQGSSSNLSGFLGSRARSLRWCIHLDAVLSPRAYCSRIVPTAVRYYQLFKRDLCMHKYAIDEMTPHFFLLTGQRHPMSASKVRCSS